MAPLRTDDPRLILDMAKALLRAPLRDVLPTFSRTIADLVPHRALAMLTADCPKSAAWTAGDPALTEQVTTAEMATLSTHVEIGSPWSGRAVLAGAARPVFAVACAPDGSAGALLAVVPVDDRAPEPAVVDLVDRLWELATARVVDLLPEAVPVDLSGAWRAGSERLRITSELAETHAATLTGLLGVLRSRSLDDATARRTAVDLAVASLIELRGSHSDEQLPDEETLEDAFGRLTAMLGALSRYSGLTLEYAPPTPPERLVPSNVARTLRAAVRGIVLTTMEQGGVTRVRVGWEAGGAELRATVRDDGPGRLAPEALAVHRLKDRIAAMGGELEVDSVPQWGTSVTMRLPLTVPDRDRPREDPLTGLNPRELEVLQHLVQGHRNRVIANQLGISEHTVKFHVARILKKLNADSRGEAAALAIAAGFPPALSLVN
ncbi:LuxR C-terminal-related transcriptional regulator [Kitasatospora sp. NPDC059146]|uniref:LuxR C-terminal-related transcriptional regulator n=1 Tax=unclassified Kitasatospora TaxID=2633591 RepID=UPI0035DD7AF0